MNDVSVELPGVGGTNFNPPLDSKNPHPRKEVPVTTANDLTVNTPVVGGEQLLFRPDPTALGARQMNPSTVRMESCGRGAAQAGPRTEVETPLAPATGTRSFDSGSVAVRSLTNVCANSRYF